jgi:hypothetical protein
VLARERLVLVMGEWGEVREFFPEYERVLL